MDRVGLVSCCILFSRVEHKEQRDLPRKKTKIFAAGG